VSIYSGSKIVTDELVFAYDMESPDLKGMGNKSWKGAPTTNLVSNAADFSGWTSYDQGNDGTFTTEFGTTGYKINRRNTWNGLYRSITLPSTGTYTISAWFRIRGKSSGNNGINVYTSGGTVGDQAQGGDDTKIGEWQRISMTRTYTSTSITFYLISWQGTSGVDWSSWDVTMPQVEAGSTATPFVDGSRTTANSLVDWTGKSNQTITLQNMVYNTDNTFDFNSASPSYLDLGSDWNIKNNGGWTVESWFNYDTIPAAYDNVYSPGNFIGSDSIGYNSWYWSILSSRLALWNISPGTWRYGSTILQANTWYQAVLCCESSGTSYQFYLNGEAEGGDHTTYTWNASYAGLRVRYMGRGNASNTRRIDGQLAITRIYNKRLSEDEIKSNFNATRGRYGI